LPVRFSRIIRTQADQRVTMSELVEAMRSRDCTAIPEVRVAMLENDGKITVIKRGRQKTLLQKSGRRLRKSPSRKRGFRCNIVHAALA
jgi:uncharacterized membrane protein YcaP (DUF421 family)